MLRIEYNGEFGYELAIILPYVYYLKMNKIPFKTISCKQTKCLFYFSENHEEKYDKRKYSNVSKDIPNHNLHVKHFDYTRWLPPPYKQFYKNDLFISGKPYLIIHNKYTYEWNHNPVNFIDINTLKILFHTYSSKYNIVYIRPYNHNIVSDHQETLYFPDYELLKTFNITDFNDLFDKYKHKYSYNELQLMLHANTEYFISVQGGSCILSSYFGGKNIVYAVKGGEVRSNSFQGWMKKLGNSEIYQVNSYDQLLKITSELL